MKKVAIVGNGDYAKMVFRYMSMEDEYEVKAFLVEKEYIREMEIYGIEVLAVEEANLRLCINDISLIMGIGYKQMGNIRKKLYEKLKKQGFVFGNYIHPTAVISKNVTLGEGNAIFEKVLLQESVVLGNCNILFGNNMIGHESKLGDFNLVAGSVTVAGCVTIGNNCFFGVSSTVRDHVVVEDYVLVGAAAYCGKNAEAYSVLAAPRAVLLEDKKSIDMNL